MNDNFWAEISPAESERIKEILQTVSKEQSFEEKVSDSHDKRDEEWIRDNKPSISYRQLEDYVMKNANSLIHKGWTIIQLLEHFKPKV